LTSKLSREHAVAHTAPGLVVVAGGKYTTYGVMAGRVCGAPLVAVDDARMRVWTPRGKAALHDELLSLPSRSHATCSTVAGCHRGPVAKAAALERARSSYAGLATTGNADIGMLTVGVQVLRDLSHAMGN
jgi:hypothetical protein